MAAPAITPLLQDWPVVRRRPGTVAWCIVLADAFALVSAGALAVLIRYIIGDLWGVYPYLKYLRLLPVSLVFLTVFWASGLYPGIALNPVTELQGIFKSISLAYLAVVTFTFFQGDASLYSRLTLVVAWAISIVSVCAGRTLVRSHCSRREWWGTNAVVFGSGPSGHALAHAIHRNPGSGLRVIGILGADELASEGAAASDYEPIPLLGGFNLAPVLADSYNVEYAIVLLSAIPSTQLAEIIQKYVMRFSNVMIVPDMFGVSTLGVHARDLGGMLGVEVSHRLLDWTPRLVKRILDCVGATFGLVVLAPVFAFLWIAIRLESPGPSFYAHRRLGRDGQTFDALKFRTMVANASEVLESYLQAHPQLAEEWARDHKLRHDPRVTTLGRFLRKTSLDELPQLWNVLRGEMSLVGPRPIVEREISKYGAKYDLYTRVSPGITGLWQVSGRNNTTYEERIAFDEQYVRNWSLWLDVYILGRTLKVIVTGEGAY